ncbi:NAD(P)-dependent dehydrogenase (Short-subunit alcohol dehydrogenase family) OS=Castellaniella defragrans OX=75697 GN=HNR28_001845 PE=4 SV=1 [Castellaniella defragrans]
MEWTLDDRLKGRVAVVTGAGSVGAGWGNGRAIAVRFAMSGATVVGLDQRMDRLEETARICEENKVTMASLECNVTDEPSIQAVMAQCGERFGHLDILVNNVGGSRHGGPEELTTEDWNQQIQTNLGSVFLCAKHALPWLVKRDGACIVNIASTSGIRWTGSPQVGYAAAKAGVIQLSRVMAVQYANRGVRVNTVVPGQLHTPMVEARLARQRAGGDVEKLLRERLARIPLGFAGDGRDTANAATFLASQEARFVTGAEIVVDGGMSVRCD